MSFGYFPDFKNKFPLKDWYLRIFGYPYAPRRNEAKLIFRLLDPKPGEKILDVGCGDGIFTNELKKRNIDVTGIDISKHDLGIAKKRAKTMGLKTKYVLGSADKIPFPDNYFDKIFSICVFEHIKKERQSFKECHRVLKQNGILIISVPSTRSLFLAKILVKLPKSIKRLFLSSTLATSENHQEYVKKEDLKFCHYQKYSEESIVEKSKNSGFVVEKIDYNVKFLARIPHNLIHTLKLFEWQKGFDTGYQYNAKHEIILAIFMLMSYPLYVLDRFIPTKGTTIIALLRKRAKTQ